LRASAALRNLGHLARDQGDYQQAAELYRQALAMVCELRNAQTIALCLTALGGVAAGQGRMVRAVRLLGSADALRAASHGLLPPCDQVEQQRTLTLVQGALDEQAISQARREGMTLTLDQAIAYGHEDELDLWAS
jgi:hypothetical protein